MDEVEEEVVDVVVMTIVLVWVEEEAVSVTVWVITVVISIEGLITPANINNISIS